MEQKVLKPWIFLCASFIIDIFSSAQKNLLKNDGFFGQKDLFFPTKISLLMAQPPLHPPKKRWWWLQRKSENGDTSKGGFTFHAQGSFRLPDGTFFFPPHITSTNWEFLFLKLGPYLVKALRCVVRRTNTYLVEWPATVPSGLTFLLQVEDNWQQDSHKKKFPSLSWWNTKEKGKKKPLHQGYQHLKKKNLDTIFFSHKVSLSRLFFRVKKLFPFIFFVVVLCAWLIREFKGFLPSPPPFLQFLQGFPTNLGSVSAGAVETLPPPHPPP